MQPAQSGRARVDQALDGALALEKQARQLQRQAEQARAAAGRIDQGNAGEQVVGELLEQLHLEGWVVLHDRRKQPGSPANLDHVLIGPAGVFVVDAKNWTGGRLRLDDRGMAVGRWRRDDTLHTARIDAELVASHVHAVVPHAPTVAVLAFVQDMGLLSPVRHQQVLLAQRDQLLPALRQLPAVLTAGQVTDLAAALNRQLPPRLPAQRQAGRPAPAAARVGRSTAAPTAPSSGARATARRKPRHGLLAVAVKVAVLAAGLLAAPWLVQHVVGPVASAVAPQLAPPAPSSLRSGSPAPTFAGQPGTRAMGQLGSPSTTGADASPDGQVKLPEQPGRV